MKRLLNILKRTNRTSIEALAEQVAELQTKYEQLSKEIRTLWRIIMRLENEVELLKGKVINK